MIYQNLSEDQKIRARNKVKKFRKNRKQKMVDSMGGKCQICGYNKTPKALEFHHVNPVEKEFSFGGSRASPKSWEMISEELKKCILLCSNCHHEVHDGIAIIPESYQRFSEVL
jgi:5-methylcytosine-specific restriction endonuclease McrA